METPQIIIRDDARRDADMVWRFLHHPQSPQYARYILKSHPEVETFADDEEKVRTWVAKWHQEHYAKLHRFLSEQAALIAREGERAFTLLGSFMEFTWHPGTTYTANLSLLPFSPFETSEFFYSVLDDFAGKESAGRSVLLVGAHEISHFIFFGYLNQVAAHLGWTLGQDAVYFLKEALTTAILNLPEFQELFGTKPHRGNPELRNIFISQSPEPLLLVPWMEAKLKEMQNSGERFSEWVEHMIQNFHPAEGEFLARMKLWRAHGPAIQKNQTLLAEYQRPITLEA